MKAIAAMLGLLSTLLVAGMLYVGAVQWTTYNIKQEMIRQHTVLYIGQQVIHQQQLNKLCL